MLDGYINLIDAIKKIALKQISENKYGSYPTLIICINKKFHLI